ncbi:glycoside hydrolase [Dendrothele bispora CBS 962.96]|uniref:alpha-1,2-Mannosidase n=1 Tax=Dendrothele bispora (strain CBS 962.96) TaxID=1314807 RepID=A0A4S8MDH4_DENBC|nr:glycoside hydrolase [Dendrothele bispora CBS 962.96]
MSDGALRKRKNQPESKEHAQKDSNAATAGNKESDIDTAAVRRYIKVLWIPLVLCFGGIFYFNPTTITDLANTWFGLDSDDGLSLTSNVSGDLRYIPDVEKKDAVVEAFKHAWRAYERDAMGADEYHAISKKGTNLTKAGGIGYTVIDSIDTMLIMGLDEDYQRARQWVETKLTFDRDAIFNTFETTIRVLGGLLSAYHLSGNDQLYLDRAIDLADRILPVFDTESGLPWPQVNLAEKKGVPNSDYRLMVSTAEVSTLQLEFRYLSYLTENEEYWEKAEEVMRIIKEARMPHGLASIYMNVETGKFVPSAIRLGSRGDSYYEYLLKQYIQTNYTEPVYKDMYDDAMEAVYSHLVQQSPYSKTIYTAELIPERTRTGELTWRLSPKQDHLVCFFGGSLMLGATITGASIQPVSVPPRKKELTPVGIRDWQTGAALVKTCWDTHDTATGLSPEIVYFRVPEDGMDIDSAPSDWYIKGAQPYAPPPYDARYILRPETVESLFIAFRLTGDVKYREWGWSIFQAIEKHCKVESGGYASVLNVDDVPATWEDKMETFLMSETLKYLYLLFEDASVLSLDEYVFNTEAHPLPIFTPTIRTAFADS